MRVLHVLHHSIPILDGYSIRSDYIIRSQQALGLQPVVVTGLQHAPSPEPWEMYDGVEYHRTRVPSGAAAGKVLAYPIARETAAVRLLRRRIREMVKTRRVDLIHAHSPSVNGLAALAVARQFGIPIVYEVRAFWEDALVDQNRMRENSWLYRLSRGMETYVFRQVDAVIALCAGLQTDIASRGIPARKIALVPNAVDDGLCYPPLQPDPLRKQYGLEDSLVIGFIGSFYFFEGLHLLIENFSAIKNGCPRQKLKLMLVGHGEATSSLKALAHKLGLAERDVIFTGQVDHQAVRHYYGVMDLLVYPRTRSRLTDLVTPLKPLEAMALRRAVLASDVGGNRELIRDGETGFIFASGRGSALVERALALLQDSLLRERLADRAQREVLQNRSWSSVIKKQMDVYAQVQPRMRGVSDTTSWEGKRDACAPQ